MKTKICLRFGLLFAALMMFTGVICSRTSPTAQAADAAKCSLELTYSHAGEAFAGQNIKLWRIAVLSADWKCTLAGKFKNYPVTVSVNASQAERKAMITTLTSYIAADGIAPDQTLTTDENGVVNFTGLDIGMYLVGSLRIKNESEVVEFEAFSVVLPGADGNGALLYDVTAKPKAERTEIDVGKKITYKVVKAWSDIGNEKKRPDSVVVKIYKDGVCRYTVMLDSSNDWSHSWDAYDDGSVWSVTEESVPSGYKVAVNKNGTTFTVNNLYSGDSPDGEPETTTSSGEESTTRGGGEESTTRGGGEESTTRGGSEESTTRGGGEESTTRGGGEESTTRGGGEESTTRGGGEESTTRGGSSEESTTRGGGEESTTRGGGEESTTRGDGEESTTRGGSEESTTRGGGEESTTRGSGEESTTRGGSSEESTTRGSGEESTTRGGSSEESTTRGGSEESTTRGGGEESTTRGGGEESTTRGGGEESTTRGGGEEGTTNEHGEYNTTSSNEENTTNERGEYNTTNRNEEGTTKGSTDGGGHDGNGGDDGDNGGNDEHNSHGGSKGETAPNTGNSSNMPLYIVLLAVSGTTLAVLGIAVLRKRNGNAE